MEVKSEWQPSSRFIMLSRGDLHVYVTRCSVDPASLFRVAERRNPKRAFLFVSRVLGRHIPTRPSIMSTSFDTLAAKIPADLPGPVLVLGMAETAVGLGAGVHRALQRTRSDTVYLVSTRHPLASELFTRFEEEHSHASAHLVHLPKDQVIRELMLNARSLILVDDEASTGKTFINLLTALCQAGLRNIERVVTATLTDWSDNAVHKQLGKMASSISLLEGYYHFVENTDATLPDMPTVDRIAQGNWPINPNNDWGRLGVLEHQDTLAPKLTVKCNERILVVGTSEFVWRPFLLAERLEQAGADVHFSSTSRSPIALGHAIDHALSFPDNYGLGIPNFLYNVDHKLFDRVLICSETPAVAVDATLIQSLNAEVIVDGE